ncbi:MAG: hypothetical protein Q4B08_11485 [Propionibacteriaceae bacterium]|nr:hypothetical protein [Propionibacteriaceae bacterium]
MTRLLDSVIAPKRKHLLDGIDQIVLVGDHHRFDDRRESPRTSTRSTGEGSCKDTISQITGELAEWSSRPLEVIYPVIVVDAMVVNGP